MRAAEYVRMSTEHQQYSIENQQCVIAEYARRKGYEVVRTYSDAARSGIDLRHRPGLRRLLEDVVSREPQFSAILVYDISRWGRFQDADESAYYEFFCRRAGVEVHYCAEDFDSNDPGMPAALMKAMKRAMAAEYLRELSTKVFVGQCRIANRGYKLGGRAGYGLRRLLLDTEGNPKCVLREGERKSLTTERVIYTPGPEDEIRVVRWIYEMFLEQDLSIRAVARVLNLHRIPREVPNEWDYAAVHRILSHPKYVGAVVFNQSSQKLRTHKTRLPKSEWIVTPRRFDPIVPEAWFDKAAEKLRNATINKSNEEMIADLRKLLAKRGRLTIPLIQAEPGIASPSTYRHRFGSMRQSYVLSGCHLIDDMAGINTRVRYQYIKDHLLQELVAACVAECLPVIEHRLRHHCLAIWGHGEFRIGLAQWVQQVKSFKWHCRMSEWPYPRKPLILGLLREGNSKIDQIALMFVGRDEKTFFSLHPEDLHSMAVVKQTAAEIVAAITHKQVVR